MSRLPRDSIRYPYNKCARYRATVNTDKVPSGMMKLAYSHIAIAKANTPTTSATNITAPASGDSTANNQAIRALMISIITTSMPM